MRCKVCHRRLTDPISVQVGIGPVCRQRVGVQAKVERECRGPRFASLRAMHATTRRRWLATRLQIELNFEEELNDT